VLTDKYTVMVPLKWKFEGGYLQIVQFSSHGHGVVVHKTQPAPSGCRSEGAGLRLLTLIVAMAIRAGSILSPNIFHWKLQAE
jgi:hypothetical protein